MALYDIADITQYLMDQGYPVEDYLLDLNNPDTPSSKVGRLIKNAQRDISKWIPIQKIGTFNTVVGQNDYDIFNRFASDPAPVELIDADGIKAKEVIWFPTTELGSLIDIFGITPLIQNLAAGQVIGIPDFSFVTPSDFTIFYSDYLKWRDRFGGKWGSETSEKGWPITLYPTPTAVVSVAVRYETVRPLTDRNWPDAAFRFMIESYACELIARIKAEEEQITINQFKAPAALKFYKEEADRLRRISIEELHNSNLFAEATGARS